ncbi:MAG: substrate-binding domain-containing protein [Proteobacteria bacterium]|nr:substrate-binding domain-containing protein [Pseudomonadota bacterium]
MPDTRCSAEAPLRGIASKAVAGALAALCEQRAAKTGRPIKVEGTGGVVAFDRVAAGEAFDFVVLAENAIDDLATRGRVDTASRIVFALSTMVLAVRAGAPVPPLATVDDLRSALLAAPRIGYSTGPSGQHLLALIERWGLAATLRERLVLAAPGVSVASRVAAGEAHIGIQQLSEMQGVPGITIAGPLPPGAQLTTAFVAAVCTSANDAGATRALLDWLAADGTQATKLRYGLSGARPA